PLVVIVISAPAGHPILRPRLHVPFASGCITHLGPRTLVCRCLLAFRFASPHHKRASLPAGLSVFGSRSNLARGGCCLRLLCCPGNRLAGDALRARQVIIHLKRTTPFLSDTAPFPLPHSPPP